MKTTTALFILFVVVGSLASAGVFGNLQAAGASETTSAGAALIFPFILIIVVGWIITRRK